MLKHVFREAHAYKCIAPRIDRVNIPICVPCTHQDAEYCSIPYEMFSVNKYLKQFSRVDAHLYSYQQGVRFPAAPQPPQLSPGVFMLAFLEDL